ncbi:Ctr copper transporter family-domain-containing protein [Podospora aff. communis PSN243]|uniref:Copper transport protein n=1 Tax=Podospora aff. communis PSN243 TaxID=3040156 RepID=A0AAV9GLQ2_9PEZI|nr:Ctr copper transporter family-domain-containing protein [Podospora aff. communis PSN243]
MDHHDHHDHHAHMDHSTMHADTMPMDGHARCSMNMLFTWDYQNVCVVFRQWHISSPLSLIVSLLGIVAIVAGYEALREAIRQFEARTTKRIEGAPRHNRDDAARRAHVIKAVLYGVQNFYAFMIMLIFMTYNGWIMIAVSVGAGLGYLVFGGRTAATKDTACH